MYNWNNPNLCIVERQKLQVHNIIYYEKHKIVPNNKYAKCDISDKGHEDMDTRYIIRTSLYAIQATTGLKEVVLFAAALAKHK